MDAALDGWSMSGNGHSLIDITELAEGPVTHGKLGAMRQALVEFPQWVESGLSE